MRRGLRLMKKIAIAAATFAALACADVLSVAQAAPPTPSSAWTGCYVGVNGGYGWNNGSSSYNDTNTIGDPINFLPSAVGFFGFLTPISYIPTPSGTGGSGGLVGGTGGCNYQIRQWVVGFEADMDWAHIGGSSNNSANSGAKQFEIGPLAFSGVGVLGTAVESTTLQWLSTIRARGGLLVSDRLLLFATGGLAVGGINSQGSVNIFSGPFGSLSSVWSGSTTTTKVGGAVGGGLEWAVSAPLSLKAEYLFYTFGSVSHPLNCSFYIGFPACPNGIFPTLGSTNSSVYGSIVRVGLNYKFW
jgi:outer membrane immunogenic protein